MLHRPVTLPDGSTHQVPRHVQRIDTRSTHGWQLRYGKPSVFFSDRLASGAAQALQRAVDALRQRMQNLPPANGLQQAASRTKGNDLPPGISGPILRQRPDRPSPECHFSVLLPRWGAKPLRRSIYIANQNTYAPARYSEALARAIALRNQAVAEFEVAAQAAARRSAAEL